MNTFNSLTEEQQDVAQQMADIAEQIAYQNEVRASDDAKKMLLEACAVLIASAWTRAKI